MTYVDYLYTPIIMCGVVLPNFVLRKLNAPHDRRLLGSRGSRTTELSQSWPPLCRADPYALDRSMETKSHDPFALPSPEKLRDIERKQNERAKANAERRAQERQQTPSRESGAAEVIQKNYRGYRARRMLQGHGIDPSTRWLEVR